MAGLRALRTTWPFSALYERYHRAAAVDGAPSDGPLQLNLGCGPTLLPNWLNVDSRVGPVQDDRGGYLSLFVDAIK